MVTSSFLPGRGGIESYLAELCGLVSPRLSVLAPGSRDGVPLPVDLEYETMAGPGTMLFPGRAVVSATLKAAERAGTEKILFGTPWPLALTGPRLAEHGLRYAVIVHASEMLVPAAVPLLGGAVARALAGAETLFAVSDFTAGQINRVLAKHRQNIPPIERLRARVDLTRFRPGSGGSEIRERLGVAPEDRLVLCFGRLVRRKGVHRLIAVADEVKIENHRVVIAVAGTGPQLAQLRRAAAKTETRTIFMGRVPEDEAAAVYDAADLFVLPVVDRWRGLETEGLGVVLLEAAASGLPCVTGRSGGTPEAVVDGRSGYVIDARDRSRLKSAIEDILSKPGRAAAMGAAGRRHVELHYSSDQPPTGLLQWLDG